MSKQKIVALIGQTNAGKSSLLNRMARKNIAIVAREEGTIDDEIKALGEAKLKRLRKEWSAAYKPEQLYWLDNFYTKITATQNVSTPIL